MVAKAQSEIELEILDSETTWGNTGMSWTKTCYTQIQVNQK